jgi:hypothetical protein
MFEFHSVGNPLLPAPYLQTLPLRLYLKAPEVFLSSPHSQP